MVRTVCGLFVLAAVCAVPQLPAQEVSLQIDFDDLEAGSDGSPAWLPLTDEWVAKDGGYEFTEPRRTGSISWLRDHVFADLDLTVRFRIADEGPGVRAPGIVFRAQSSADHYYVHYDSKNTQVILVRSQPGKTWNELKRVRGITITPGEWHDARVTCQGNHLAAYLDGKVVAEADDDTLDAGIIGLRAGQGRIAFDDLKITGSRGQLAKEWVLLPETKPNDDLDRPQLESAERIVAVRGGGYFPVLIKLQDGSLGAVVRGGAPHIGVKGRLDWIRSTDGGKTWSEPAVIVDSKWDDRNPALGQMSDGTIVMAYAEAQTYNEQGEWDTSAGEYIQFFVTSKDSGATWSEKQKLYTGAIRGGSPFGRTIVLSDGTALMPMYGRRDPGWEGKPTPEETGDSTMSAIVRSKDDGQTWEDFSVVSPTGHNEFSLLALTDEHLLAVVRTVARSLDLFESKDSGYTWEGPTPLTQRSQHPGDICRLASGKLLCVWGNRREPLGVGSMISEDNGKTWGYDGRVMLGWTSLSGDCGYPSVVQLDDGMIVVMYYSVGTTDLGGDEFALVVRFTEEQYFAAE
jgi:hypothetical protein